MGEASSVKVSDREVFASCNLRDTFKVWSLVYTWRYPLPPGWIHRICSGAVRLGKSSGSRRVWSCAELPQELGLCEEGELSPSWAVLTGKEHFGSSLCSHLSKGSLSLKGSSGELWECGWAEPNPAQGGIQNLNLQNSWFKQTNKQTKILFIAMQ